MGSAIDRTLPAVHSRSPLSTGIRERRSTCPSPPARSRHDDRPADHRLAGSGGRPHSPGSSARTGGPSATSSPAAPTTPTTPASPADRTRRPSATPPGSSAWATRNWSSSAWASRTRTRSSAGRRAGHRRSRPGAGRAPHLAGPARRPGGRGAAEPRRGPLLREPLLPASRRVLRPGPPADLAAPGRRLAVGPRLPVRAGLPATAGHVAGVSSARCAPITGRPPAPAATVSASAITAWSPRGQAGARPAATGWWAAAAGRRRALAEIRRGRYAGEIDGDLSSSSSGRASTSRGSWRRPPVTWGYPGGAAGDARGAHDHPEKGLLGFRMGFPTMRPVLAQLRAPRAPPPAIPLPPADLAGHGRRESDGRSDLAGLPRPPRRVRGVYHDTPVAGLARAGRRSRSPRPAGLGTDLRPPRRRSERLLTPGRAHAAAWPRDRWP